MARRFKHGIRRGPEARIIVDGQSVRAYVGESLATALLAAGIATFRSSPGGAPRSAFCHMGVCQECVVHVNGRPATACTTVVEDGLDVRLGAP